MSTPPSPPPPRRRAPGWVAWLWRPLLVLAVAGALGWWMLGLSGPRRTERAVDEAEPPPAEPVVVEAPRQWRPREIVEPAPGCRPEADRRCLEGDVWWVDSCGVTYARAEDCGARRCQSGECEPPPPGCGDIPLIGRCDGDVAQACEAGYPLEIDCGARGLRCVLAEDGPVCRPPSENACDPATEPPVCDGFELVTCMEGERQRVDCRTHEALCGRPPGGGAACLQLAPPVQPEDCDDPCGCPPPADAEEVCDGRDNDGDGWIDESGTCEPVDLVFIVIGTEDRETAYAREDIDEELARLQQLLSREDDYGIELRLADVVFMAQADWLELDLDALNRMMLMPNIVARRDAFYVPIVLTERVLVDEVPRPGLSTVPNGICGGLRRSQGRQPVQGLIAVAKRRWPTTLAHELGHFFGLCHTHADHPPLVVPLDPGESGDGDERVCVEPCTVEGDGICDTPVDPGPRQCRVGPECALSCEDGSGPDPTNLMGYYPECRHSFTEQQALLMRRSIALRRDWYRCRYTDECSCTVAEGGCPEGMSCRRFNADDDGIEQRCALDGPVVPGGVCSNSIECSVGSQCIRQPDADARCVRPCTDETVGCSCAEVGGVEHPICVDDLGRE